MNVVDTGVCIVGGGPAGATLALLLARGGVDVALVETTDDYSRNREFRGDSITVGCVSALQRLGVFDNLDLDQFLKIEQMVQYDDDVRVFAFDFRRLALAHKFGWMDLPQPVLLNELVAQAVRCPTFRRFSGTRCVGLAKDDGAVTGAICDRHGERFEIRARLVVGADGRHSPVARMGELPATRTFIDRDVVWFKLPRPAGWGNVCRVKMRGDRNLAILPTYPDWLRIAYRIPKGTYGRMRKGDIAAFHADIAWLEPAFGELVKEHVRTWKDTVLLDIFMTDRPRWSRDGLLLIGDAAHTVSPITGQGVNLAIQDAIHAAPVICHALQAAGSAPIPAAVFAAFEQQRRRQIRFVTRMQRTQEWMLSLRSAPMVAFRRLVLWLRDRYPGKDAVALKLFYSTGS
jgi:2-polyprenyl-6-methoxyphenol hydroxylase-like FAD-dependent oxidoreductase